MKTIKDIRQEILDSLQLGNPETTVQMLNDVYEMPCTLEDDHIILSDNQLKFTIDSFSQFITQIINNADRDELVENYELLTGQRWEWVKIQDESDCHPEHFLRNKAD